MDWKDKNIILTDHVIEEYADDNKSSLQRADIRLRQVFNHLLNVRKAKKLDSWSFKWEVHKMRYNNEVVVFKEEEEHFLLITYYKYIPDKLRRDIKTLEYWVKKKINPILSGKKERHRIKREENKKIRQMNRDMKKYNVQKLSKMNKRSVYNRFR